MTEKKTGQPEKEFVYVPVPQMDQEDEIDLLELWNPIWRGKWFIAGFTFFCTLVAVVMVLFILPVTYKSDAVLQPIEPNSNNFSDFSSLAGNLPIPINLPGGDNKSANIMSFLESRTLKIRLITEFNLLPKLYPDMWDEGNQKWDIDDPEDQPTVIMALQQQKLIDIFQIKQDVTTSLITISWVSEDPKFAASMLNHVIDKLNYYLENEYDSDAKKEREFVEVQFRKSEKELEFWEQQLPSNNITLSKIQRELLASQTVYTELRKQLELAKISEIKEIIRFKVLDKPFIPEEEFEPNKKMICGMTIFASGFLSVLIVFVRVLLKKIIIRQNKL